MKEEGKKRSPRIPLTPEEVAELIEIKKIREFNKLQKFKKSKRFKLLNYFNVLCFFVFCELIFSFFGPCFFKKHFSINIRAIYTVEYNADNQCKISELEIIDVNDKKYNININDFIEEPLKYSSFIVFKDYLLQKEIKVCINNSEKYYWIQSASPILFISVFLVFYALIFYTYNLNQNPISLTAISILNGIALLFFIMV